MAGRTQPGEKADTQLGLPIQSQVTWWRWSLFTHILPDGGQPCPKLHEEMSDMLWISLKSSLQTFTVEQNLY